MDYSLTSAELSRSPPRSALIMNVSGWCNVRVKTMVTHEAICDDKEEMGFLVDAFAVYVSLHYSEDDIIERIGTAEDLLNFFEEYLDHLKYHL